MLRSLLTFIIISSLLTGCASAVNGVKQQEVVKKEEKMTVETITEKMMDSMKKARGYALETDLDMAISPIDDYEPLMEAKVNMQQDVADGNYYLNYEMEGATIDGNISQRMEMYKNENAMFMYLPMEERWGKLPYNQDFMNQLTHGATVKGILQKIVRITKLKEDVSFTEDDSYFIIEFRTQDEKVLSELAQKDIQALPNNQLKNEGIQFDDMSMYLWIDKNSYRLTRQKVLLKATLIEADNSLQTNKKLNFDFNSITEFKNEIHDVAIPKEVLEAETIEMPLVSDSL
ncbi:hypothetical protein IC619_003645 [Hazenella sp. IB182353]|uniref:DUF6612 family protein n=1 Tax=Polycladospora coralii TaxID=2771432 RepID=UPI001747BB80|nr:DUF6612 family protein [Polycladospora coralii]MBS7529590.1 hypothetical protein [Polycladospora coralii]